MRGSHTALAIALAACSSGGTTPASPGSDAGAAHDAALDVGADAPSVDGAPATPAPKAIVAATIFATDAGADAAPCAEVPGAFVAIGSVSPESFVADGQDGAAIVCRTVPSTDAFVFFGSAETQGGASASVTAAGSVTDGGTLAVTLSRGDAGSYAQQDCTITNASGALGAQQGTAWVFVRCPKLARAGGGSVCDTAAELHFVDCAHP